MSNPKVVAWGECGLDFFKNQSEPDVQKSVFVRQMKMAVQLGKPIVIHSRDADEDTLQLMTANLPSDHKVHLHCFGGAEDFANKAMQHFPNLFIGFTGAVTFNNAQRLRDIVKI